jgi:hypothetical protein
MWQTVPGGARDDLGWVRIRTAARAEAGHKAMQQASE